MCIMMACLTMLYMPLYMPLYLVLSILKFHLVVSYFLEDWLCIINLRTVIVK
jgi:hypothetical protein